MAAYMCVDINGDYSLYLAKGLEMFTVNSFCIKIQSALTFTIFKYLTMDQLLKPKKFDNDPTCICTETNGNSGNKLFSNFLSKFPNIIEMNK